MAGLGHDRAAVLAFRHARMRRESPRALAYVGLAILVMSVVNVAYGMLHLREMVTHTSISVIVWIAALIITGKRCPDAALTPLLAFCAIAVTAEFQWEYWVNPTIIGYAYVLVIMVGAAPMLLSPTAFAFVAAVSSAGALIVIQRDPASLAPSNAADWGVLAITAEIVGGILLMLRLRAIDELGEATALATSLASTDALTGLLNRHGMELQLPAKLAAARHANAIVHTVFIDIDGLKVANDLHGHDFGDDVIRVVAQGMRTLAPEDALLARWGGDEFVGISTGEPASEAQVAGVMRTYIEKSGIDLTKWTGTVSVGVAVAPAGVATLERLVAQADAHMYERRRAARSAN